MFKSTVSQIDFVALEKQILEWWYSSGVVKKYLTRNQNSTEKFSFLDGPITANNPMGVHHAWGRTYKDLFQRYHTYKGAAGRYQNGFDCQGLWVEVEVEKELGFKTKKDIEAYGVDNFVQKCKDRVNKYAAIQTEQSKRLGYFMDWENSYFTMSDTNNYEIWRFLKECWQRGWLYKGKESVPWCPRCETAISQHEMLTEDYKEVTHQSVYLKFRLVNSNEYLLVWTTTPWTIPANIAIAVDKDLEYVLVDGCWIAKNAAEKVFGPGFSATSNCKGNELVGKKYTAPFDHLPAVAAVSQHPLFHTVVATDSQIMPISDTDGTGMVHTAVSAGIEDFKLGKKLGLPMITVIDDTAAYVEGLGDLSGKNAKKHPEIIIDYLKEEAWLLKIENITHRYPACWRCKTELVWKVADEWYIAMDRPDPTHPQQLTYRQQMKEVAKTITWMPDFGLDRELDWLENMHDWLISKKNRYWGLALPIYESADGSYFEVIGSKSELEEKSVSGWEVFLGHSPHKPWIDEVKIKGQNGQNLTRISDVGNVWLDAGIVPFSTLPKEWFPADFITESFPGQFKNWFYAMLAMSTVLTKSRPFKTVLGYGSLLAEDGRPMHKSWGNSIEFNEGADKIGADVMRWMYAGQNPYENMLFGYKKADETRRRFHLTLWNVYHFFVTYANIDSFSPSESNAESYTLLDRWILSRLNQTIAQVTSALDSYSPPQATKSVEDLVSDLSLWYVRRSRDRVGPSCINQTDKQLTYNVLHTVLVTICSLIAPFMPFLSEEMYKNLTGNESVHLSDWPSSRLDSASDLELISNMARVRKIVELGLAKRKAAQIKVRQPIKTITIYGHPLEEDFVSLIKDELNIKEVVFAQSDKDLYVEIDTQIDNDLLIEGQVRELIRTVQEMRKQAGAKLDQKINLTVNMAIPDNLLSNFKLQVLAEKVATANELKVELI